MLASAQSDSAETISGSPALTAFVAEMAEKHHFDSAALQNLFAHVYVKQSILKVMARPAEAKPWDQYRPIFVNRARILQGVKFRDANANALMHARQAFGVPEEIITAIIGVETHYGRNTGSFRVLDALATLAFDYPPRADYFRGELEQYLLLTREGHIDPLSVQGSYAGAMGICQFMPSSYRQYGIDFDGDGRSDLWRNTTDAIGSVANYFRAYGWEAGQPVAVRARVSGERYRAVVNTGWQSAISLDEMKALGVIPQQEMRGDLKAMLIALETSEGPEYWLAFNNFYAITRYNHSFYYAMAVYQLSRELAEVRQASGL